METNLAGRAEEMEGWGRGRGGSIGRKDQREKNWTDGCQNL